MPRRRIHVAEEVHIKCSQWSESESHSVLSNSLGPHGLYSPWNSPGQNTEVGSFSLLQGIFPTQGSNPGLLHCRKIFFYQLSHKGSPRILEWVAYPFSRGSSHPRNWTRVSCIAGRFFTNWANREAQNVHSQLPKKVVTTYTCRQGEGVPAPSHSHPDTDTALPTS